MERFATKKENLCVDETLYLLGKQLAFLLFLLLLPSAPPPTLLKKKKSHKKLPDSHLFLRPFKSREGRGKGRVRENLGKVKKKERERETGGKQP